MNVMGIFSNITFNKLLVNYSNAAVAGIGIAKKIDMLAFAIANGLSQGVIPLIGYNYSAKNTTRMRSAIKVTLLLSLAVTTVGAVLLFTCANPLVRAFIDDAETVRYGSMFQRIICITGRSAKRASRLCCRCSAKAGSTFRLCSCLIFSAAPTLSLGQRL